MDLINKKVMHKTFGKGNIVNYDDSYMKIKFKSGARRFVYPDGFKKYLTLMDQKATNLVNEKIKKKEARLKKERKRKAEELEKQRILQEEQLRMLEFKKKAKNRKFDPRIQSVFWVDSDEEDQIFTEWKVFTGEIKSGANKGKPRKLARMSQNSACLITKRENDMDEKDRQILGVFMANKYFDGRTCDDGYISAHPEYRIQLSKEEAEKMLFWYYYVDIKATDKTVWNSGRQRYFDNIWMAQILRDIVLLKEDTEDKEEAQKFFDYFCEMHFINKDELPKADGPLMRN